MMDFDEATKFSHLTAVVFILLQRSGGEVRITSEELDSYEALCDGLGVSKTGVVRSDGGKDWVLRLESFGKLQA